MSWIDRLTRWIGRLPWPSWLFYVAALLAFSLLNNVVFWVDGSLAVGAIDRVRVLDSVFIVFFVALYHHLRLVGGRSFRSFRPVLKSAATGLPELEYQLTTLPRRMGWLSILAGIGFGIEGVRSDPRSFGLDVAVTVLPVIYQHALMIFVCSGVVAFLLQTIRQLRFVNELHRHSTEIDLFQLAPAHAFSRLTARAGIGLILFMAFNGLLELSNISAAPLYLIVVLTVLALAVFLVPLLGMRERLTNEKARLLSETHEAIKLTIGRVHSRVNSDDYEETQGLNTALSALIQERSLIQGISTWPWEQNTLRGFASTLLVPLFLWLLTRFLERLV